MISTVLMHLLTFSLICSAYPQDYHFYSNSTPDDTNYRRGTVEHQARNGRYGMRSKFRGGPNRGEDFAFPDNEVSDFLRNTNASQCFGSVCESASNYPIDYFKRKLSGLKDLEPYFEKEKVPIPPAFNTRGKEDTMPLCSSKFQTIYPVVAENTKKEKKAIVNVDGYVQAVPTETCVEGSTCLYSDIFPNGLKTKCIQKYTFVRLVAEDTKGELGSDLFSIPSCCSCHYVRE